MRRTHYAALAVCLLLAVLAFHLGVAWQGLATLSRNGFLYDDSFYAFKIAQNIAEGRGVTFDGVHATSGFQPLYVFLLVPAFLVSGRSDPAAPVHLALSLLAVVTCLTAYLLYVIARRYVGRAASLVAALVWAFSPVVTRQGTNGLETALATFFVALVFFYYVSFVRSADPVPARRFLILGLLLGLAVLARSDSLLLVLAVLLDYLLLLRRRGVPARRLAALGLLPVGILLLYGPWCLFCVFESGSALQDSGAATRFLSLAYASYFHDGEEGLALRGPDAPFIWNQISHSAAVLRVIPPVHVLFRSIDKLGVLFGRAGAFRVAANILGFAILGGVAWAMSRWRKSVSRSRRGEIDVLLLFSGFLLAAYSLYIFGAFYFMRYYYPLYFVACLCGAFFLQDAFDWSRRAGLWIRRTAAVAATLYVALFAVFTYWQTFRSQPIYPFYDVARWVKENTASDETIGVFQCGTIGYLSDRRIVNLDGKVNRGAFEALKGCRLESYLRDEGVDVVIDHASVLDLFLGLSPEEQEDMCTTVPQGLMKHPTGWVAVRWTPRDLGEKGKAGSGKSASSSYDR